MKIRIVSPAGAIDADIVDQGAARLRSWGHDVDIAPHAKDRFDRYAGTPPQRAADIIDALTDPTVDLLWCSRGGYGCHQILDRLPVELIAHARKPIVGYSDVTALHALWQKAGVASVHAPMMRHLAEQPAHTTTQKLRSALLAYEATMAKGRSHSQGEWPRQNDLLRLAPHPLDLHPERHLAAPIVGGNLAVLNALHGTPFDFTYSGHLLFIEDVGESPYKIDRMMQTLRLGGMLSECAGLIVGRFTETNATEDDVYRQIHDLCRPLDIAVRFGAGIGHVVDNYPVVEGAMFQI